MRRLLITANFLAPLGLLLAWAAGWGSIGLLALLVVHAATLWATLHPGCTWWGPQISEFATDQNELWLTIDDGPDPEDTPVLLEALDRHGAKATFFLIGEKARRHPELVAAILASGHSIGNHTLTHPQYWFWAAGPGRTEREMAGASSVLQDLTSERPTLCRAPAGMRNMFLHPVLKRHGLRLIHWTARGLDGRETDRDRIVRRIINGARPGAILLLHEGRRDAAGRSLAQDCVPRVLSELTRRGYRFVIPSILP
jgi:peptidoglycan/xylan/chitin deacetylase (PgdA/CDA1 family)